MGDDPFTEPIARFVWETRYRDRDEDRPIEASIEETWRRVAHAVAQAESQDRGTWERRFLRILRDFRFLPGGRILAGAGTKRDVTLLNCFVMGTIRDDLEAIFENLKECALTMKRGGGIGCDFSTLRPRGAPARGVGLAATGPVSFLQVWDATCATILASGARRGAMMGTLRCDHPDIEAFVEAKREPGRLKNFNLSVLVTDEFLEAVERDRDWPLVFPAEDLGGEGAEIVERPWPGKAAPVPCRVLARTPARGLWDRIMRATYDVAEPGVLFVDTIRRWNNLHYCERISATNPCGEIPLPPYGVCNLGSINLTRFVRDPFSKGAEIDFAGLREVAKTATRFLDDVLDITQYPLPQQAQEACTTRRIGLGITGLADALLMLGLRYGEEASLECASRAMRTICHAAYRASVAIAREKGRFPAFEREAYLAGRFVSALPAEIRDGIARAGIRNSHLTAIAPTGTVSLLANNVSSGLEPIFAPSHERKAFDPDGIERTFQVTDAAWRLWRERAKGTETAIRTPPGWVDIRSLRPVDHLAMQAALQRHVDHSVSKTIHVPEGVAFEEFRDLYSRAHALGLKGCTTYRPNPVRGSIFGGGREGLAGPHCCAPEREAD